MLVTVAFLAGLGLGIWLTYRLMKDADKPQPPNGLGF